MSRTLNSFRVRVFLAALITMDGRSPLSARRCRSSENSWPGVSSRLNTQPPYSNVITEVTMEIPRSRLAPCRLRLALTSPASLDRAAHQEQAVGERGLARVRVGDHRERAPSCGQVRQMGVRGAALRSGPWSGFRCGNGGRLLSGGEGWPSMVHARRCTDRNQNKRHIFSRSARALAAGRREGSGGIFFADEDVGHRSPEQWPRTAHHPCPARPVMPSGRRLSTPAEVDALIRKLEPGEVITPAIRGAALARRHKVAVACPFSTAMFADMAARAAEECGCRRDADAVVARWRNRRFPS